MTTTPKLSPAQREVLEKAMNMRGYDTNKPICRLPDYGISSPTLAVLVVNGWAYRDQFVRDPLERQTIENRIKECIQRAKDALATDNWGAALKELERVNSCHEFLNRTAYWITDAARALIEGENKP